MRASRSRSALHAAASAVGRAALGACSVLAVLLAADYLFVAHYSYVMQPGRDLAHYQEFAQLTAPPFATVAGFFVTFIVASWMAAGDANPWPRALLLVAACAALDASIFAGMGLASEIVALPYLLSASSKLAGAALAAWCLQVRGLRRGRAVAISSRI